MLALADGRGIVALHHWEGNEMGAFSVVVAAAAAYAFGAVWYMLMARPWMDAVGPTPEKIDRRNPVPYIVSGICVLLVAGMMRHVLISSGVTEFSGAVVSGLGLGLFVVVPWIVTNYTFARRPPILAVIDGGYAVGGCTIIGAVLALMG